MFSFFYYIRKNFIMRILVFLLLIGFSTTAQHLDSVFIRKIYNTALSHGHAYENLRSLCKDIGNRLSGSIGAKMAIEWSHNLMKSYNFDSIYLQAINVPYWKRGNTEAGWIKTASNELIKTNLLALGGSIGTNGILEGEIIEFKHLDELKKADKSQIQDKIVFINQPMDPTQIVTFRAYGGCVAIRVHGAIEAAKKGATAVIIRSVGIPIDKHPHTGMMVYDKEVKKIPAAAISTHDAEKLAHILTKESAHFVMQMDCDDLGMVPSYNVIAEIKGSKHPNQIITVGGHLDSWDTGEGAHDDGAGVIHSLEALRILKSLNYKPNNTLRVVFFMNEENGNHGGKNYAQISLDKQEKHIAAIESDAGGFSPRGFSYDGPKSGLAFLHHLEHHLSDYQLHAFVEGHAGVDISPLKKNFPEIALFGLIPDSQRYFDVHHTPNDVFENVNKRELELGCAAIASLIYLIDQAN